MAALRTDKGLTLAEFSQILVAADDTVFHSLENVIDIFKKVDQTFCDDDTCFTYPCTFESTCVCWAASRQQGCNRLFNPRGAEVLQSKKGLLCFRTMDVDVEDLDSLDDVKYLCLYLWFLRQHSCVSAVYLSLPVLAPRHVSLFTSLLKLTDGVRECEIRGNDPFMGPSLPMAGLTALRSLSNLRELGLATVHLTDDEVDILARLVERNESLVALVLIDVEMSVVAFLDLVVKVTEHKKLQDFRVKMNAVEHNTMFDEALGLIGTSGSILRLHVHVDRGLVSLLRGLISCPSISELIVENMIEDAQALSALANFLEKQQSCRCLKVCIDAKKLERVDGALDDMQRIVGKSSLEVLVLSGSVFAPLSVRRLADGLAMSKTLKQLHLDECELACADVLRFVTATKERTKQGKFEELNLGAVTGSGSQLCDMFKAMIDAHVCHIITLTYSDCLVPALGDSLRNIQNGSKFTKVTLSYGEETEVEPALKALRLTDNTLKSLCIDSPRELSILGGQFLAYLIRNCKSLTVLQLRCGTKAKAARQILKAIAQSRSIVVLAIERWCYKDEVHHDLVHHDLVDMLGQNESLHRLEFYLRDVQEYENLKPHLVQGVSVHEYLTSLKIYIGEQREELVVRDPVLLEHLRRNAIVQDWTTDIMLRGFLAPEAAGAVEVLDACESRLDLLRRTGAFSPRTADNRLHLARMATRTKYYLLLAAYRGHEEFAWSPDSQERYRKILSYVRDQALNIKGIPQERTPPSNCTECDIGRY
ncbi:uncharacterized protein LOC119403245 isoform X2 [Rhipicephalus sanguineus]|uniref:uncharacterized protein LOC119403245 isoform X2 n=1 Tax=Rhipicephalus sanguineus TaxID=34632 RepID=UPI0020C218E3|nr:uncharacterized protein LOC119403245 isoform X2 [Rhipicephalus sanguineus]